MHRTASRAVTREAPSGEPSSRTLDLNGQSSFRSWKIADPRLVSPASSLFFQVVICVIGTDLQFFGAVICDPLLESLKAAAAMAIHLADVVTSEGLEKLNEYLLTRSYISGYQASRDDLSVYFAITATPDSKFPNVCRWYSHITALLSKSFPGLAVGVHIAGSPASTATRDFTPAPSAPTPAAETVPVPTASAPAAEEDEDDDDLDLFGEETEEEKAASAKREAEKKASGKKVVVGKSSVLMDVKPWDDETDMKLLEAAVRSVEQEGLTWGASKLVEVGYGIKKLQIMMTIVDDLVSPDNIIEDFLCAEPRNEHIQSCDIVAFNKI